jgi:hydroxymethylbilane synthase
MSRSQTVRIGTRASKLARWQADWVADRLRSLGHEVVIVEITTQGDANQTGPVGDVGSPGVFTKEIQRALLASEVDVAVHSLKDLPTGPLTGLVLAAVPPRENAADVLVSRNAKTLSELQQGARVGTGSLRRQAQLRHGRPDLRIEGVRGNVDTRLRKLDNGDFDALVLADAGLRRLGLTARIAEVLPQDIMLPAVGQGALGIECRADDPETINALSSLDDPAAHAAITAERTLLACLSGGCLAPVGALAQIEQDRLKLRAVVLNPAGTKRIIAEDTANQNQASDLGERVANVLLNRGAAALIAESRLAFPS